VNDGVSVKNAIEKILIQSGRIDVLAKTIVRPLRGVLDLSMYGINAQYETNFLE
jgi:hypothetical protein